MAKRNDGALGVDGVTFEAIERPGAFRVIEMTQRSTSAGRRDASTPRRLVAGRLDWRRASATRFAYARSPRQSSQHLGELIEGTLAISLSGRDSTTGPKWADLAKRTSPAGQQSERNLHRG